MMIMMMTMIMMMSIIEYHHELINTSLMFTLLIIYFFIQLCITYFCLSCLFIDIHPKLNICHVADAPVPRVQRSQPANELLRRQLGGESITGSIHYQKPNNDKSPILDN